jgi:hypothetical protein
VAHHIICLNRARTGLWGGQRAISASTRNLTCLRSQVNSALNNGIRSGTGFSLGLKFGQWTSGQERSDEESLNCGQPQPDKRKDNFFGQADRYFEGSNLGQAGQKLGPQDRRTEQSDIQTPTNRTVNSDKWGDEGSDNEDMRTGQSGNQDPDRGRSRSSSREEK